MKKITKNDLVTLEHMSNEDGEKLFNELLGMIKKAYDDLNMDFDIYAFEKTTAKIVKLIDERYCK